MLKREKKKIQILDKERWYLGLNISVQWKSHYKWHCVNVLDSLKIIIHTKHPLKSQKLTKTPCIKHDTLGVKGLNDNTATIVSDIKSETLMVHINIYKLGEIK